MHTTHVLKPYDEGSKLAFFMWVPSGDWNCFLVTTRQMENSGRREVSVKFLHSETEKHEVFIDVSSLKA